MHLAPPAHLPSAAVPAAEFVFILPSDVVSQRHFVMYATLGGFGYSSGSHPGSLERPHAGQGHPPARGPLQWPAKPRTLR